MNFQVHVGVHVAPMVLEHLLEYQQVGFTVLSRQDRHGPRNRLIGGFAQGQPLSRIHFGIADFGRFSWLALRLSR